MRKVGGAGSRSHGELSIPAIIPARGGSKGIPRKNVISVAGKPLIVWAIEAAHAASAIGQVIVSTDDDEIAEVSRAHGADVVTRPRHLATDESTSESVLLHVFERLQDEGHPLPELTVFLQCTAPLTTASDIDGTVQALVEAGADSALAVAPFHHFLWRTLADGQTIGVNHDPGERSRRQDRDSDRIEAGSVYAMRTKGFLSSGHRFFGRVVLHEVALENLLEIDAPADLLLADFLLRHREAQVVAETLPATVRAVVFDFDGVFTDNRVLVGQGGEESVLCDRGDGLGIELLRESGIEMLVLSREENLVGESRCRKLKLPCKFGIREKLPVLLRWLGERGLDPAATVFVGNDINDLECFKGVGCAVAVRDAHPRVAEAANVRLNRPGGRGAVRELAEMVLLQTEPSDA